MRYNHLIEEHLLAEVEDPLARSSNRPKYYLLIKYTLLVYLIAHIVFIAISLPSDIDELTEHEHRKLLHILFLLNIVLCALVSIFGVFAILKEKFLYLSVFSLSMVVNVLLLVYAASLHTDRASSLIVSLFTSWLFTSLAIGFAKLNYDLDFNDKLPTTELGYFHRVYSRAPNVDETI